MRLMRMSVGWKDTRVFEREMMLRGLGHRVDSALQVNLQPANVGLSRLSPSSTGESFATFTQPLPFRHAQAQGDSCLVDFCNCFTLSWAMTSVTTKNRPTSNRNFKAISSTRTMVNVWTEIQHCELVFGSVVTLPNPIKEGKQTNLTNTFLFSFTWLVVRSHQGCGVMTCRRTRCTCPNKEPSLMDHSC